MVKVFKALESLGLRGFLGCRTAVYEEDLQDLFANSRLERNIVFSTVRGSPFTISEEIFAGSFQLPTEGLVVFSELPERLVAQIRMDFAESKVSVHSSCKKNEIKVEYRLLNDIIAKAFTAKAGSFDAVTESRFDLMEAIIGCVRINWTKSAAGGSTKIKAGESKTLPSLKILSVKSVGTYVSKNKSAQAELVEEKKFTGDAETTTAPKAKLLEDVSTRAEVFVQPAVKRKRTRRAAVRPTVPIQMVRPPKRKLILLEDSDSEDAKPLTKDIKVSAPMDPAVTMLSQMNAKILEVPDDESLSLEELIWNLRAKSFPSSVMSREPIIEIRWSQGIHIREVNWRTRSLLKISLEDKGKNILVEITKGNPAKEMISFIFADILQAEIAGQEKFRELFLRKNLNERRKNLVHGDSFARIDIQIMDVLAEAHRIAMIAYLGLRKQHKLVWTLPGPSNLFSGPDEDIECLVLSSRQPTVTQCIDLVVHPAIQITEAIPDTVFKYFQHGQHAKHFCGFFEEGAHSEYFRSSSACEPVEVVYEEFNPAQTDRSFIDSRSALLFSQTAVQLRDLVSNITLEQLHSQELLISFKTDFNERMKSLELSVEDIRTSHVTLVNKKWIQHLDLLKRGDKLKADLSSEITSTRLMLHEEA
ncbi:hypothetical protein F511_33231 [Dorcoceras hygrometricum]|uniref:Uncharacterized protein n=1 Tax=Dorcoceras hygrometricum TaxID=472368 RepID=A0A2Z7BUP7_9LAMI|nr:hypothetical protein F511_33231 [Dorcoceras hygrometricum]